MELKWMIETNSYSGIRKQAVNMVSAAVSDLVDYVIPVVLSGDEERFDILQYQRIVLGVVGEKIPFDNISVPNQAQGYGINVGKDPSDENRQIIIICGNDEAGLFYGCVDFANRYCGAELLGKQDMWKKDFLKRPMHRKLPDWKACCAPAIGKRGIWTWGHMIFDYRGFFENMAKLRLNQIVIWNDHPPVNADDVVRYAHEFGIEVIWGFSWGWNQPQYMVRFLEEFDDQAMETMKQYVLETYRKDYAHIAGDGIYFQSFTELFMEEVGGKCIAQLVVDLVNSVGGALLDENPGLELQFGLHAISVKTKCEIIAKTDKRIRIVWEDCGSFPFDYRADTVKDFDATLEFTKSLLQLRGEEERFGCVLKGMTKLDWFHFSHFVGRYVMGERTEAYMTNRRTEKQHLWKLIQAGWMRNGHYAKNTISAIADGNSNAVVQALVEDGMLERDIMLPVAMYAQMLWEPERNFDELLQETALWPCVHFGQI